jgi:opacity protein-like surface antigen
MKALIVFITGIISGIAGMAQTWEFGSDFALTQPVAGMNKSMNNAFGMSFNMAKRFDAPFAVGLEGSINNYGSNTTRQAYEFDDGSVTETNVRVSHDLFTLQLTGKYFLRNGKNISPYVSGKIGLTWFQTNLTIEDPEDEFSCEPLESDILSSDHTYLASGGAGVRVDFNSFFRKMETGKFYLDLSVHSSQGGAVRYMNSEVDPSQPKFEDHVMAEFINTQSQVIHEHHVGYVYSSLVNTVDYRLGVIFRIDLK